MAQGPLPEIVFDCRNDMTSKAKLLGISFEKELQASSIRRSVCLDIVTFRPATHFGYDWLGGYVKNNVGPRRDFHLELRALHCHALPI